MIWRITSFPLTHLEGFPVRTNFKADGTLNQAFPVTMPAAMSVLPTPVEKAAQGSVGTRMGIGADHRIPGGHQSLFRQERMLDAHVSHVKIVGDPVNIGKIPGSICSFLPILYLYWG